jgi:hypothetical protein
MRYALIKTTILVAAGILGLWLYFVACDGDGPVGPTEPKDYVVYFRDGSVNGSYYGYHPATGQLDTFMIPAHALWQLEVSADGKRLYALGEQSIGVVDVETLELLYELPYLGWIAFSPDNQLVAIQGDSLYILRTADHSVFFEDTTSVRGGCFSRDSKKFYCCGSSDSQPAIHVVDLVAGPSITTKPFSDASSMVKVMPSHDESKWFLFRRSGWWYITFFDVYDVQADSIIFRDWLIPTSSSMALTPDGRYVFYTVPDTPSDGDPEAPSYFTVFDVEKNRIKMLISTVGFMDGFNPIYMPVGGLAMTPDGQWIIVGEAGSGGSIGATTFIVFNIEAMEIENYMDIQNVAGMYYTCQSAL